MRLDKVSLSEVLPPNLRADAQITALAKSLDAELQKLSEQARLPLHLPRLNELNHEVLDLLAYQFDALFYEPENMTLATKRRIIAKSLLQWKKIGTPYAVREMLDTFATGTKISEWFEYGGEPYHFKLVLQKLQDLEDDGETILRLINAVKNVRSWLDAFDFNLIPDAERLHVAFADATQGKNAFDLNSQFIDKHRLIVVKSEIITGEKTHAPKIEMKVRESISAGFTQLQSGHIVYKSALASDIWYELFLKWIKSRWANWRAADIYYRAEIIDDEVEEDTFSGNYLKIWLSYHNSDLTRLIVLPHSRSDLTASDIHAVNVDGIFTKRGYLSDKIIRSVYVEKSVTKLQF